MMPRRWWPAITLAVLMSALPYLPAVAAEGEEDAVRAFVQTWVGVSNKQDVDGILALFAVDAQIASLVAGGKVSKEWYAAAMKQGRARGVLGWNFEAKITSLNLSSAEKAILEMDTTWDTRRYRQAYKQRWTLIRREGRWLILETQYLR